MIVSSKLSNESKDLIQQLKGIKILTVMIGEIENGFNGAGSWDRFHKTAKKYKISQNTQGDIIQGWLRL